LCRNGDGNQTAPLGLEVFEASGVEPVFPEKRQAINYAAFAFYRLGIRRFLDVANCFGVFVTLWHEDNHRARLPKC